MLETFKLFFSISPNFRYDPAGKLVEVYRSEALKNNANPEWREFELSETELCGPDGDRNRLFHVGVYDKDLLGRDGLIGHFEASLNDLKDVANDGLQFDLAMPKQGNKRNGDADMKAGAIEIAGLKMDRKEGSGRAPGAERNPFISSAGRDFVRHFSRKNSNVTIDLEVHKPTRKQRRSTLMYRFKSKQDEILLQLAARELQSQGKAFLRISKQGSDYRYHKVCETEVRENAGSCIWEALKLSAKELCGSNSDCFLLFEVFDHVNGRQTLIGSFTLTFVQLVEGMETATEFKVVNQAMTNRPGYIHSGIVYLLKVSVDGHTPHLSSLTSCDESIISETDSEDKASSVDWMKDMDFSKLRGKNDPPALDLESVSSSDGSEGTINDDEVDLNFGSMSSGAQVTFTLEATDLDLGPGNIRMLEAYFTAYRVDRDGAYQLVYTTDRAVRGDRSPTWQPVSLSLDQLCKGDTQASLVFHFYCVRDGPALEPMVVGSFSTSVEGLMRAHAQKSGFQCFHAEKMLRDRKGEFKNFGSIRVKQFNYVGMQ